jgi:uncharacterized protein YkwD
MARRSAIAAALAAVILPVAGASAASAACQHAGTPATKASTATMRRAVLCLINHERTSRGLPALHASRRLNRSAQRWTDHMVATGVFSHGSNFGARITATGYHWRAAGENIATGFPTPRSVVRAWMASTGHCQNILDPAFRDVGTGLSRHPVGHYAGGPSTWTQDFGLPANRAAPSHNGKPARGCPY